MDKPANIIKPDFMMDRDALYHLPTFVLVAETASFSTAASRLGISSSAVSQAIRALEAQIGSPLFLRTTRHVALTDLGRRLLEEIGPRLRELDAAVTAAKMAGTEPSGLLRLNVPRLAFPMVLQPILVAMRARYPAIRIEIAFDDAAIDIVAAGFDAGIRLGSFAEQDMIAIPLTPPLKSIIVASPSYLERRPAPATIEDLAEHDCIAFRFGRSGGIYNWEFDRDGQSVEVPVDGALIINDTMLNLELAVSGNGIAYLFEKLAEPYLADGRLVRLLPQHSMEEPPLCLYFPRFANRQPKLRIFIDIAKQVALGAIATMR